MTIKESGTELNLAKKDDVWTVKERADYPADFDKVSALIRKLWELKPVQDVKVGPSSSRGSSSPSLKLQERPAARCSI